MESGLFGPPQSGFIRQRLRRRISERLRTGLRSARSGILRREGLRLRQLEPGRLSPGIRIHVGPGLVRARRLWRLGPERPGRLWTDPGRLRWTELERSGLRLAESSGIRRAVLRGQMEIGFGIRRLRSEWLRLTGGPRLEQPGLVWRALGQG